MSWDLSGSTAKGKKAEFTSFPVGITRIRIIDDAPMMRWTHWWMPAKRSINCPGKGCPICEIRKAQKVNKQPYTQNMARRYAINIINRETKRVEIMEQGVGFFEQLLDVKTDIEIMDDKPTGKTLLDADVKVKRKGTGQEDTSYRLDKDVEAPLSDADEKLIVDKTDLLEYFKAHTAEQILRLLNGEAWEAVFTSNKPVEATSEEDEDIVIE